MVKAFKVSKDEYNKYLKKGKDVEKIMHTQDSNFAKIKEQEGNKVNFYIVKDLNTEEIIAKTLIIYCSFKKIFYRADSLYGPVVAEKNYSRLDEICKALRKEILKNIRVMEFRINPLIQKNIYEDLTIVSKNVNKGAEEKILKAGFKRINKEFYEDNTLQARYLYVKNIKDMTMKDIEKSLVRTLRNRMKKAEKEKLQIRYLDFEELDIFFKMLEHTYNRVDTITRANFTYAKNLYKYYKDKVYVPLVYIDILKTKNAYIDQKKAFEDEIKELDEKYIEDKENKKYLNRKQQIEIAKKSLEKNIEDILKLEKEELEKGNEKLIVDIYSGLFIDNGNEMIYLYGAGYDKYFSFNGAPLMHKEMLKKAVEKNMSIYNMFGVTGIFSEEAPDYGVLKFKQTFNGQIEEYIGTYRYGRFF